MNIFSRIKMWAQLVNYNLKIVFANKFVYFMIAAMAFFLLVMGVNLFNNSSIDVETIYNLLLFPGILIIFYPVIFNVHNDKDSRMLEVVFAVPNYRFKVYLIRFLITLGVLLVVLYGMGWLSVFAVLRFSVSPVVWQLMFPLVFIASLSLVLTTLVKNGGGAAVIVIIIGLFFWILAEPLEHSKWNLFLNPFNVPSDMNQNIWQTVVFQNRIGLFSLSLTFVLWSLINLQKREKYV